MESFDELAARVDQLRDQVSHADESTQALLRETIEAITEFNRRGLIRTDRTLDVLQVFEQIRPHLIASSIDMSVEEVRDDVAYVKFPTGCSAPDQQTKDEIMGVLKQRVTGLRDVIEVAPEPSTAFVSVDTLRVGPP